MSASFLCLPVTGLVADGLRCGVLLANTCARALYWRLMIDTKHKNFSLNGFMPSAWARMSLQQAVVGVVHGVGRLGYYSQMCVLASEITNGHAALWHKTCRGPRAPLSSRGDVCFSNRFYYLVRCSVRPQILYLFTRRLVCPEDEGMCMCDTSAGELKGCHQCATPKVRSPCTLEPARGCNH